MYHKKFLHIRVLNFFLGIILGIILAFNRDGHKWENVGNSAGLF